MNRSSSDSSKAYNIISTTLSPDTYERMVQLSWRRSGTVLYRPQNDISCCPNLAIRLPVADFKPSKSQRKAQRTMQKLLNPESHNPVDQKESKGLHHDFKRRESIVRDSGILESLSSMTAESLQQISQTTHLEKPIFVQTPISFRLMVKKKYPAHVIAVTTICAKIAGESKGGIDRNQLGEQLTQSLISSLMNGTRENTEEVNSISVEKIEFHSKSGQVLIHLKTDQPDTVRPKEPSKYSPESSKACEENKLREWFSEMYSVDLGCPPYQMTIETFSAWESAVIPEVHRLFFEYQQDVHGDPNPFTDSNISVDTEWGNSFNHEWSQRAKAMLYREYSHLPTERRSMIESSFGSFYEFLVENPFPHSDEEGTFHQHYRIGGVLVAVGVIDMLPQGLSSVYLFYSPSFAANLVPLGKVASLKEIEYSQNQGRKYYYLGYYIESCRKMRYKAEYRPSQILCPIKFRWVDAVEAQRRLVSISPTHHYGQLYMGNNSDEEESNGGDTSFQRALKQVQIDIGMGRLATLDMLNEEGKEVVLPLLHDFVTFVTAAIADEFVVDLR